MAAEKSGKIDRKSGKLIPTIAGAESAG